MADNEMLKNNLMSFNRQKLGVPVIMNIETEGIMCYSIIKTLVRT